MSKKESYFKVNMITSLVSMLIQFMQSLIVTSYVQRNMGIEAYGYISVVVNLVNMAGILTVALTSVCSRYMVIELEEGNKEKARRLFSTIMIAILLIMFVCALMFLTAVINITKIMVISPEYVFQVKVLMGVVAVDFIVQLLAVPFLAVIYYEERLYVFYILNIISNSFKIIFAVLVFTLWQPVIWAVYVGALFINIIALLLYIVHTRTAYPFLELHFVLFDKEKIKEILSSGVWVSVSKLAATLLSSCSTYLVNILIGAYLAGVYGSIAQLQSILSFMTVAIVNVFLPQMYKKYAVGDKAGLIKDTSDGLNVISSVLGVVSGGLIIFGNEFMSIWITEEYLQYSSLIIISVCYLQITYSVEILNQLLVTINRTKIPALASIIAGIVNIILALFFVNVVGMGIYGIAFAQLITMVGRSAFWVPMYTAHEIENRWCIFINNQLRGVMASVITVIVGGAISNFIIVDTWIKLLICSGITGLIAFAAIALLNRGFREFILSMIKSKNNM